jgi:hypothetical protein
MLWFSPRAPHEAHRNHRSGAGCTHRKFSQWLAGSSGEDAQECPVGSLAQILSKSSATTSGD